MPVTKQDILPHIPKATLRPLLVALFFNLGMADFLDIELSHLYRRLAHGQNPVDQRDDLEMGIHFLLDRRGQPLGFLRLRNRA